MLTLCMGVKPDRHEEIAIEGIDCPACEALEKLRETKEKLLEANKTIQEQDETIAKLQGQGKEAAERKELEQKIQTNAMDVIFGRNFTEKYEQLFCTVDGKIFYGGDKDL